MTSFSPGAVRHLPPVVNEPIRSYAPGSPERASLQARLAAMETERPASTNGRLSTGVVRRRTNRIRRAPR